VDPKNRRAVKRVNGNVVTRYVWQDQLRIIAELDSNNLVKSRFVYAEGVNSPEYMVKNGQKFMFIKDHRGSINLVVLDFSLLVLPVDFRASIQLSDKIVSIK